MAVYREPPKCPYCGKIIAKANYRKVPDNFFGDSFQNWEYIKHSCKGTRKKKYPPEHKIWKILKRD